MRVLVVHSFYSGDSPSGENVAVEQQVASLRRAGVQVLELFRTTDALRKSNFFLPRAGVHTMTGWDTQRVLAEVRKCKPDIVSVHNLSPNFGVRWIRRLTVPTVLTLHNYRFSCANGLHLRQAKPCTKCVDESPLRAVQYGCYQSSRLRSVPWALGNLSGGALGSNLHAFDAFIAQTPKMVESLSASGVSQDRIRLIPGFVERRNSNVRLPPPTPRYVFVGRDTVEKGLGDLVKIWPEGVFLDAYGAKASQARLTSGQGNISFKGSVARQEILHRLNEYTALVFPGIAWEGAIPLVVREAAEAGVPVLAREGTSVADFVTARGFGCSYSQEGPESLFAAMKNLEKEGLSLRNAARRVFLDSMEETRWQLQMRQLFNDLDVQPPGSK